MTASHVVILWRVKVISFDIDDSPRAHHNTRSSSCYIMITHHIRCQRALTKSLSCSQLHCVRAIAMSSYVYKVSDRALSSPHAHLFPRKLFFFAWCISSHPSWMLKFFAKSLYAYKGNMCCCSIPKSGVRAFTESSYAYDKLPFFFDAHFYRWWAFVKILYPYYR